MATTSTAATYALTTQQDNGEHPVVTGDDAGEFSSLSSANANRYSTNQSGQSVSLLSTAQLYIQGSEVGSGDAATEFRAFCVQIDQGLGIPSLQSGNTALYDRNTTHFDTLRRDKLATLFFNEYDPDGSIDHQAAFQLAIWKLVHTDLGSGAAYDLSSDSDQNLSTPGYFNYDLDDTDTPITEGWRDKNGGAVWALTGQFLEGLDEDGTDDYANVDFDTTNLTFMVSANSQNILVLPEGTSVMQNSDLSTVPLPPGLALTLSGLGLLGLGRRRGRA